VIIKLLAAVAKENNHGTIASAQKAGRTAKAVPKSRGKGKGKQVESIAIGNEDDEAGDSVACNGEAGDSDAGEPVKVPKPRGKPGPKAGISASRRDWLLQAHESCESGLRLPILYCAFYCTCWHYRSLFHSLGFNSY